MSETSGSYTPPPPPSPPPSAPTPPTGGGVTSDPDRNIMIVLSYLGPAALIPFVTKKEDADIQWHSRNGLALTMLWAGLIIVFFVFSAGLPWPLRWAWRSLGCVVWLGVLLVDLVAMMKALSGDRLRLPVITDFAEKL